MPFTIVSEPPLSFALADTILAVPGTPTDVQVTGDVNAPNLSLAWLPPGLFSCASCPATTFTVEQDTVIHVEIMDEDGCVYLLDAIVRITPSFSEPVFPNIFSPNGDGLNDRWTPSSTTNTEWIESLQIFDRWGNLVFSANQHAISAFAGWDGTFKNQPLGPAVFTYIGQLRTRDGQIFRIKGDVTLIK